MTTPETDPHKETPEAWLARMFEHEYCHECSGDAEHHDVISDFPFPGTFFARCKFLPSDDVTIHPTVLAFRKNADPTFKPEATA